MVGSGRQGLGDRFGHVLDRHVAQFPQRREQHRDRRHEIDDHADPQRLTDADRRAEDAADQATDRNRAPDQESDARVHPALQPWRADRLPERHLRDVVDDGAVGRGHHADREQREQPAVPGQREQHRERCRDQDAQPDGPCLPDGVREPPRGQRTRHATDAGSGQHGAGHTGRRAQLPCQHEDRHRPGDAAAEVAGPGAADDADQRPVAEHEPQALRDLAAQVVVRPSLHLRLDRADPGQRDDGPHVAQRVDAHRVRGAERLRQPAGDRGPGHLRDRLAGLQLGVAVHQLVLGHQRRQVRLVGHVEEHREHADREADQDELDQREHTEPPRDRDTGQQDGASGVGADHQRPPPHPVHPGTGGQPDQQERGRVGGGQQAHLERCRGQDQRGEQGSGGAGDHRAELADRVADP